MRKAAASLDEVPMNEAWRPTVRRILNTNINYMTMILEKNQLSLSDLEKFGQKMKPNLKKNYKLGCTNAGKSLDENA